MKTFNRVFTVIVFLFLYIPMIVLAVASFNAGTDIAVSGVPHGRPGPYDGGAAPEPRGHGVRGKSVL